MIGAVGAVREPPLPRTAPTTPAVSDPAIALQVPTGGAVTCRAAAGAILPGVAPLDLAIVDRDVVHRQLAVVACAAKRADKAIAQLVLHKPYLFLARPPAQVNRDRVDVLYFSRAPADDGL